MYSQISSQGQSDRNKSDKHDIREKEFSNRIQLKRDLE